MSSTETENGHIGKFKIVVFVIVIIGFIALAYFLRKAVSNMCSRDEINDPVTGKCRKACEEGQFYIDGNCLDCPTGQSKINGNCVYVCTDTEARCGNLCYDPDNFVCISDGTLCSKTKYQDYIDQCCDNNTEYKVVPSKYFPTGIPDTTAIVDFMDKLKAAKIPNVQDADITAVGDILINAKLTTVADIKGMPSTVWKNIQKNNELFNQIRAALSLPFCAACSTPLCGGVCCDNGKECVNSAVCCDPENVHNDNCCAVYSEKNKKCCGSGEVLDADGDCATQCGVTTCKTGNTCVGIQQYDDRGTKTTMKYYCANNPACTFTDFEYDPQRIKDSKGTYIPLCKNIEDVNSQGPFLYCKSPDIVNYTMSASDQAKDPSVCSDGDALSRTTDYGRISASWDPKTGKVTEIISCIASPVGKPCTDVCPGTDDAQCCRDGENKLTGTICPENKKCWLNPSTGRHECAIGFTYRWDQGNNKWVCQTAQREADVLYHTIDDCKKALKDTVGHPACLGDGTRGKSNYPNGWRMRNGNCYRNLPDTPPIFTGTGQDCGIPGSQLTTEVYHSSGRDEYPFCDDNIDIIPKGNITCQQHDDWNAQWINCNDVGGCKIHDGGDSPWGNLWHRYYYNSSGSGLGVSCKIPPPET